MTAKAVCRESARGDWGTQKGITCERMDEKEGRAVILVLVTLLRACFATKGVLDGLPGRSCLPDKLTFSLPYQVVTARDDESNSAHVILGFELQVRAARRGWALRARSLMTLDIHGEGIDTS